MTLRLNHHHFSLLITDLVNGSMDFKDVKLERSVAQRVICLQCRRPGFDPWVRKIPWRRKWQPTPVLLPGKSHGQRSLADYSPWDRKESDTTEQLHFTSLVKIAFYSTLLQRSVREDILIGTK